MLNTLSSFNRVQPWCFYNTFVSVMLDKLRSTINISPNQIPYVCFWIPATVLSIFSQSQALSHKTLPHPTGRLIYDKQSIKSSAIIICSDHSCSVLKRSFDKARVPHSQWFWKGSALKGKRTTNNCHLPERNYSYRLLVYRFRIKIYKSDKPTIVPLSSIMHFFYKCRSIWIFANYRIITDCA